eukprot:5782973-Pyramimonas_sp.AAC.1
MGEEPNGEYEGNDGGPQEDRPKKEVVYQQCGYIASFNYVSALRHALITRFVAHIGCAACPTSAGSAWRRRFHFGTTLTCIVAPWGLRPSAAAAGAARRRSSPQP